MVCARCKKPTHSFGKEKCVCALIGDPVFEIPDHHINRLSVKNNQLCILSFNGWVPVELGEGWRFLQSGEEIKKGDEYFHSQKCRWESANKIAGNLHHLAQVPFRRRKE